MREGTLPDEEPGLFLVSREAGRKLYGLSAMDDEEDQETPFQEMDAPSRGRRPVPPHVHPKSTPVRER
jgi:hypothetical protein